MGATTFDRSANHANLAVQKWSRDLFKHNLATNPFASDMGTGDDKIIQVKKDFLKEKGDKITFALRGLLAGSGQGDDGTYEGNEEAMTFLDDSVFIHENGHSTKLNGNMTEQRTLINLREQSKLALGEWLGRRSAADIVAALSGLKTMSFAGQVTGGLALDASSAQIETVNQVSPTKSATALRYWAGGQTTAGVVTRVANDAAITSSTTCLFGSKVIEHVKRLALTSISSTGAPISPIRPVMVKGKAYFVMYIDELDVKSLMADTNYVQAVREAEKQGESNPLFTGALAIWQGVVLKPIQLLHRRTGAGGVTAAEYFDSTGDACASGITVVRKLFCGAQAGLLAYGKLPTRKEKSHDYDTKYGVHTNTIYGVKKSSFTSGQEFGCIIVDTAVATD
jgi:N4-gp56 family major capsid protein